jgi:hypothetical protein
LGNRRSVRRRIGLGVFTFFLAAGGGVIDRWSNGKGEGVLRERRIAAVNGAIRERASYDGVARNTSTKDVHIGKFPLGARFEISR